MRSLKKLSRRWNADYGAGVADNSGVSDAGGLLTVGFAVGALDGLAVGNANRDDAGDAWDDVAGRSLERYI
jgi:hypothetical protein